MLRKPSTWSTIPYLVHKLYRAGVPSDLWEIMQSLHTDCAEHVVWNGAASEEYMVRQGVRQGGDLFQVILDFINSYACTNRYQINPQQVKRNSIPRTQSSQP